MGRETIHMQGASQSLKNGKKSFPICIPKCSYSTKSDHHESRLPSLRLVSWMVEESNGLNHNGKQICHGGESREPAQNCQPSLAVAEKRHVFSWSMLRSPMILCASNGRARAASVFSRCDVFSEPYMEAISAIDVAMNTVPSTETRNP
jgi:hypothetical protein